MLKVILLVVALSFLSLQAETPAEETVRKLLTALQVNDTAAIQELSTQGLKLPERDNGKVLEVNELWRSLNGEITVSGVCEKRELMVCYNPNSGKVFRVWESYAPQMPQLSKKEMYADFDHLTEMLLNFCYRYQPNRQVYGLDMRQKLASYREKIAKAATMQQYVELVYAAVSACKGNHLWVVRGDMQPAKDWKNIPPKELFQNGGLIEPVAYPIGNTWKTLLNSTLRDRLRVPHIPLLYWQGHYYSAHDTTIGSVTYPRGMKLRAISGRPFMETVTEVQDFLTDFDAERGFFHGNFDWGGDSFYLYRGDWGKEPLELTFEDQIIRLEPEIQKNWQIKQPEMPPFRTPPAVSYWREHEVIYIRLPAMDRKLLPDYLKQIPEAAAQGKVKAAIIDIRYNEGGSDPVWNQILGLLQTGRENTEWHGAIPHNPAVIRYMTRRRTGKPDNQISEKDIAMILRPYAVQRIAYLDNAEFLVSSDTYPPFSENCLFPESLPVYLLTHDIYSSAGNLFTLGDRSKLITTVGFDNPRDLGQGVSGFYFSLPHSKLIIRADPWLDLSNCTKASDVDHNKVKVKVEMTAAERLSYQNTETKGRTEEYLLNEDPFVRKALELIKASQGVADR